MSLTIILGAATLLPIVTLLIIRITLFILGHYLTLTTRDLADIVRALFKRDRDLGSQETLTSVENDWEKVETVTSDQKEQWSGIIGFFHPFCNAGGGGERVLWAAISASQKKYPNAIFAVYTGDNEIERSSIIETVKKRFDITLQAHSLHFIYLQKRPLVLASAWPRFTLLGQSIGSVVLAYEAFSMLIPDVFIDTMGYAFATALCRWLFPKIPTAAYVHYPTISTDMLASLDDKTGTKGIHSGAGTGLRGRAKKIYWELFAKLYSWAGRSLDVVMCNSTWTANHIRQLWKPKRPTIVYPPCPVTEVGKISLASERDPTILYVAQFRPEKNHDMILKAFAKFYHQHASSKQFKKQPRLVLVGSVRTNTSDERHVYALRLLAHELKVTNCTTFITDAPFSLVLQHLQTSSCAVNGMYAEHFGIGNVEAHAAGLILIAHNSGGPKEDICIPYQGQPVGCLCETEEDYARAFAKVLVELPESERQDMRVRARKSAARFSGEVFEENWITEMQKLIVMARNRK